MKRALIGIFAPALLMLTASQAPPQGIKNTGSSVVCPRYPAGSIVLPPPDIHSQGSVLNAPFKYNTTVDADGRTLFCFQTPAGLEGPTLRLVPGDRLNITATNALPAGTAVEQVSNATNHCGDAVMYTSSLNIHYHGTTTSPSCHQDQVVHTIINSGQTFQYSVPLPTDMTPGLYWYHAHIHGIAEAAALGGASGAIVVDGIQNYDPWLAGTPERVLIIRDQPVAGTAVAGKTCAGNSNVTPSLDLTINYVPLDFRAETCTYTPAVIEMQPGGKELWRVCNCGADTTLDLQVLVNEAPRPLVLVGLDGVPTGSQNGAQRGTAETVTHIQLTPAARAEFVVQAPGAGQNARLVTQPIDTGPYGDIAPLRTIAVIKTDAPTPLPVIPPVTQSVPEAVPASRQLANQTPTAERTLYFSEAPSDPANPNSPTDFFITVDGAKPALFDPNAPPAIVTAQGAIEDWTIQNRTQENHEFHFHQLHFLVEEQNGFSVPQELGQFLDMVHLPYWSGSGPYPSVTLRMDFRGADIGDFVYHCHVLFHEDGGMMAIIRVMPPAPP